MNFFRSFEAVLVAVKPRKQGPDEDRVLKIDLVMDILVPDLQMAYQLDDAAGDLLFGPTSHLLKNAAVATSRSKCGLFDISVGFERIINEADEGVALFFEQADVKITHMKPDAEETSMVRAVMTVSPDDHRAVQIMMEKIEDSVWFVATEAILEREEAA
jgi:hypothetical protein